MSDRTTSSIPEVKGVDPATAKILRPIREMLHNLTNRNPKNPAPATLDGAPNLNDLHNKVNELIRHLGQ